MADTLLFTNSLRDLADPNLTRRERRDMIRELERQYAPLDIDEIMALAQVVLLRRLELWQRRSWIRAYGPTKQLDEPIMPLDRDEDVNVG